MPISRCLDTVQYYAKQQLLQQLILEDAWPGISNVLLGAADAITIEQLVTALEERVKEYEDTRNQLAAFVNQSLRP
jgi:hypothetical protein